MVTQNPVNVPDHVLEKCIDGLLADEQTDKRPCVECGTPTTGSVGAAGIRWPMLCQKCKDHADAAALLSAKRHARIAEAVFADDGTGIMLPDRFDTGNQP